MSQRTTNNEQYNTYILNEVDVQQALWFIDKLDTAEDFQRMVDNEEKMLRQYVQEEKPLQF